MPRNLFFTLLLLFGWAQLSAQLSKAEIKQMLRMLQAAPTYAAVLDSLGRHDFHPDSATISVVREALWQRLLEDQVRFPARKASFEEGRCEYVPDKWGKFSLKVKGERPEAGYPVYIGLHGGGGGPQEMNDEQWQQMQTYYLGSIDTGIYIAPRGPNNTWDLHFDGDAQAFYERLLRDAILFGGADPNRIYLLGYSAGGDGVYQLAPRLAPYLAAASMSAGHHNGVHADNLQHLPMLLQVGELDAAYDRNRETVRYALLLDSLERRFPGEFRHVVYVHADAEHSYVRDHAGAQVKSPVLEDARTWLGNSKLDAATKTCTDAPTWLARFRRQPFPRHVRWDATTRVAGRERWYWVSLPIATETAYAATLAAEVRYYPGRNQIEVLAFSGPIVLHLHEAMVDPRRPLEVIVDGKPLVAPVQPSMLTLANDIWSLGDPNLACWGQITVARDSKNVPFLR